MLASLRTAKERRGLRLLVLSVSEQWILLTLLWRTASRLTKEIQASGLLSCLTPAEERVSLPLLLLPKKRRPLRGLLGVLAEE